MLTRLLSLILCMIAVSLSLASDAQPAPPAPPPTYVQKVYSVAPDASGNDTPGCNITAPASLGANMAFNGMDASCNQIAIGPLETTAQSAIDIAAEASRVNSTFLTITGAASTYQPIGSYLTPSALTPYLPITTAAATYCPLATCPTTSAMNAAIAAAAPAAYVYVVGAPVSKSPTFGAAVQATTSTKAATVTVNWTSTASISLSGGATNTATIGMASTSAAAITGSTVMCTHSNSNTGALTVGLNLSTIMATTCSFSLPAGWYWAPKLGAGTVTITSAYDQAVG